MTKYELYVQCEHCSMPHPVQVSIELEDGLGGSSLDEIFGDRQIPSQIAFMQTNKYRCPHTGRLFPASDAGKTFLQKID
jgi:hypothetical protein